MARIPAAELERLKAEVSVERLAVARGVKLERRGADLFGLCPWHDDHEPSLVISPEKNLWNCLGACQEGGDVIAWVQKAEGVSFRHAVELLRADLPLQASSSFSSSGPVVKRSTVKKLPVLVTSEAEDQELLGRVVEHYHESLKASPEALEYLRGRGLSSEEMVEEFRLGYANRTLGYRLPEKNREEGARIRGRLAELGVYRKSGHEHLAGSVVVPLFDAEGRVVQMYGRKIRSDLRKGTPTHLYLPGEQRGVFNLAAFAASKEMILCEAILDALTFWCAGYRNVTTAYGVNGLGPDLWEAFRRHGTERVLIAFDRDEAGEKAAGRVAEELIEAGMEAYRIQFPKGMDANEYAVKVTPAAKSLGVVIRAAVWMGKGKAPRRMGPVGGGAHLEADPSTGTTRETAADPETTAAMEEAGGGPEEAAKEGRSRGAREPSLGDSAGPETLPGASSLAALPGAAGSVRGAEPAASPDSADPAPLRRPASASTPAAAATPPPPAETEPAPATASVVADAAPASPPRPPSLQAVPVALEREGEVLRLTRGDRVYEVRGLGKNATDEVMKVNVRVSRGGGLPYVDTLDLCSARLRQAYVSQASKELEVEEEVVKKDLGQLFLALEMAREAARRRGEETEGKKAELTDAEREAALGLLRDRNLLGRILEDFQSCGVVGEETNKLVGYLAAVSRKLDHPLAIVIQSSSAAGKSSLMEAFLAFMPEEERVSYSAMTGQSLFYMGENDLEHKILAVAEEEGAERASYALKLLQSEGELTIASTGKDPTTGRLVTHEYKVKGPVMIFLTTTAIEMDEELLNRCLVLTVDEGREQTRAIHELQRRSQTLEGILEGKERGRILELHRNAQRLLRPLCVVNPYARELRFQDHRTRMRRDHMKYLTLISSITLLHQYQREVKTARRGESEIQYVEVTREDLEIANRLVDEVLGQSLDELPPQTRRLLGDLTAMVATRCQERGMEREDYRFTRRELREWTGLGNTQLKIHLKRLEELEYVLVHASGRNQSFSYELAYLGAPGEEAPLLSGHLEVEASGDAGTTAGGRGKPEGGRGEEGLRSGGGRPVVGPWSGGGRGPSPAPFDSSQSSSKPSRTEAIRAATIPARSRREEERAGVVPLLVAMPGRG